MFGSEYNWLVSSARNARGVSVRLARGGLLTLAVGAFCATCALLPSSPALAPAAPVTLAAPTAVALKETAESEAPRLLIRLWVLVPYLLPQR